MKKIADLLFLTDLIYFVCMATAHFFSLKYPVLFIYYNVPFHSYQDKIISFAVVAYVALFFEAYRNLSVRYTAISVMYLTVAGLSYVNMSPDLSLVMKEGQSTGPYWIQTIGIFGSTLALHFFHFKSQKRS